MNLVRGSPIPLRSESIGRLSSSLSPDGAKAVTGPTTGIFSSSPEASVRGLMFPIMEDPLSRESSGRMSLQVVR